MNNININVFSDRELVNQYWNSEDPVVARLCRIVDRFQQMTEYLPRYVEYSEEWGWTVDGDELGHYIDSLKSDRDYFETEMLDAQEREERLSARSVAKLLGEMQSLMQQQEHKILKLHQDLGAAEKREQLAQEKLDMWTTLSREHIS